MNAALWSVGFRPFFLLAASHALASSALWLLVLGGHAWPGAPADLLGWHAREMLTGFAGAAMAGFLLTAVPTFTGRPATRGWPLALLAGLWLTGRLAGLHHVLAAVLAPAADLAFGLGLLVIVARDIIASRNRRNFVIVGIVAAWIVAVGAVHAGRVPAGALLHLELLLLTLIAGRIIPAFTASWMRQRALEPLPASWLALDLAALASVVVAATLDLAAVRGEGVAAAFALAGGVHALRLSLWRGGHALAEPLVWSLHLAYAWLPVGYLLFAASVLTDSAVPHSAAVHAMTIGVIGSMVLTVMSRVVLGHTGRALHASRAMAAAYLFLSVAALSRVLAGLEPAFHAPLLMVSGSAWLAGFGLFIARHGAMLVAPRADLGGEAPAAR